MKIRYNAPVILTFTLISILVLLIANLTGHQFIDRFFSAYPEIRLGSPMDYFRMVSYVAGHANWQHLASNFSLILLIGPLVEEKYGSVRLFEMMVVTAILTALLNAFFFSTGLIGASGIAFMLILLGSFSNIRSGDIPLTFIIVAILFLGAEVVSSLQNDQVSQFAHLAGGVMGAAYGFIRT
ncbi:MAG: rhomboid family intramembrane serine protease [Deltaproteobacteria bacterium]|nr:MAG: rhomboid family intramembrane serine protease [Deltaproteobacteria bacterium]